MSYVSDKLAGDVAERAQHSCEYCMIAIEDTYFGGEIDHIRSRKHGGTSEFINLALACQPCNRNKGSDLGSIFEDSGDLVRFFNPRLDDWKMHFQISESGEINAMSSIGQLTVSIFKFNDEDRVKERRGLIELGRYPSNLYETFG